MLALDLIKLLSDLAVEGAELTFIVETLSVGFTAVVFVLITLISFSNFFSFSKSYSFCVIKDFPFGIDKIPLLIKDFC